MNNLAEDNQTWSEPSVEREDVGSNLMEEPFNPSDIDIDTKSPTLSLLITRLKTDPPEIDLYPDFQRKDDLWDEGKQSRLIESILISFPLPAFYFDGTDDDKWLVVDGLQRLSALRNFTITKTLRLKELEFLKDLENKSFDELPRSLQRKIEETQIVAYVIKPGTPPKVKYNIFRRINTGGLVLEPQEIRHALNQGVPAKFVAQLAEDASFKKVTENRISPARMQDREFVTRFIAFYLTSYEDYNPDLDTFLNDAMGRLADLTLERRTKIKSDFIDAMKLAREVFGKWAFRKSDLYPRKRKPINKALFEVWSVTFAHLSLSKRALVLSRKKELMSSYVELMKTDSKFVRSITSGTGGKSEVVERFSKIRSLIDDLE